MLSEVFTDGLRNAVEAIVGDRLWRVNREGSCDPLRPCNGRTGDTSLRAFFSSTAYRLAGNPAFEKYASSKWKCVEISRSPAAVLTYCPARWSTIRSAGEWVCWDGGIVANNPASAAAGEVFRLDLAEKHAAIGPSRRLPRHPDPDARHGVL